MQVVMGVLKSTSLMDFGGDCGNPKEIQSNERVIEAYLGRGAAALAEKLSEKRSHVA
jgi:hypothetical protein